MDPRVKPEDDGWRPGLFLTHLFDVTAKRSLTNHAAVRPAPFPKRGYCIAGRGEGTGMVASGASAAAPITASILVAAGAAAAR
jgi:hypothetical protein